MGLIDLDDLYPDYPRELLAVAGNSGPGWPIRPEPELPMVRCIRCERVIEVQDARWVHRWPNVDDDHQAVPPDELNTNGDQSR